MGALVFTPFQTALINPNNLPNDQYVRFISLQNFVLNSFLMSVFSLSEGVMSNVSLSFLKLGAFMVALQVIGFILVRKHRGPVRFS